VAVTVALAAGGLAACTGQGPDPKVTGNALAAGITKLELGGVALNGTVPAEATKELRAAVQGMGGLHPTVTLRGAEVAEDNDEKATAVLNVVWDLGAGPVPATSTSPSGSAAASSGSSSTTAAPADPAERWTYTTTAQLIRVEDAWQAVWSPALLEPTLRDGDKLVRHTESSERGDILGAGGKPLITMRTALRTGIDKTQVPAAQAAASARALAALVGINPATYANRVSKAGAKAFVLAVTLRTDEAVPDDRLDAIPGAVALAEDQPLAPTKDFARPILGSVGAATAEQVAASGGRLSDGDLVGRSGLELRYDPVLRGTEGIRIEAVGADDQHRDLLNREPVNGQDLSTTLDPELQIKAEALLAGVKPASALVAVRPSSGDVLVAASGPGGGGQNTAMYGRFAPGSTFKVATALALLRSGVTPATPVPCTPTVRVEGKQFKNYDDYPAGKLGNVPLRTAFANSCNTAFIGSRDRVDQAALRAAAASLGLGVDHDLGTPAFFGSVPAQAAGTEHAASMIGQGRVEASPLAMATLAASVAKGATVVPHLLAEIPAPATSPNTSPSAGPTASAEAVQPLTEAEANTLRELMRAVVTEGSGSVLAGLPGAPVGAKTGTAEFGKDNPPKTHTWMIATHGDLAVAVLVAVGESGSKTAGPILKAFLS
jgi:cell division protein FtsI/penicillin-binding protein 2